MNTQIITRHKSEAGLNIDVMSNTDRNELHNMLQKDVTTGVRFTTPHDNIGYYVVSSSDNKTVVRLDNGNLINVKHGELNSDPKINAAIRKAVK